MELSLPLISVAIDIGRAPGGQVKRSVFEIALVGEFLRLVTYPWRHTVACSPPMRVLQARARLCS